MLGYRREMLAVCVMITCVAFIFSRTLATLEVFSKAVVFIVRYSYLASSLLGIML